MKRPAHFLRRSELACGELGSIPVIENDREGPDDEKKKIHRDVEAVAGEGHAEMRRRNLQARPAVEQDLEEPYRPQVIFDDECVQLGPHILHLLLAHEPVSRADGQLEWKRPLDAECRRANRLHVVGDPIHSSKVLVLGENRLVQRARSRNARAVEPNLFAEDPARVMLSRLARRKARQIERAPLTR